CRLLKRGKRPKNFRLPNPLDGGKRVRDDWLHQSCPLPRYEDCARAGTDRGDSLSAPASGPLAAAEGGCRTEGIFRIPGLFGAFDRLIGRGTTRIDTNGVPACSPSGGAVRRRKGLPRSVTPSVAPSTPRWSASRSAPSCPPPRPSSPTSRRARPSRRPRRRV